MKAALIVGALLAAAPVLAQVGQREFPLPQLPVTLVYPSPAAAHPLNQGPFTLSVALNAEPSPGQRRLVVISHGSGGSAIADHALAATLARAGFVVAQPLHRGDNWRDTADAGPVAFARRPTEVSAVIDALARDPFWSARLDLRRVGVHGMSAGGSTALALAGGQWRLADLARHCRSHVDEDIGFCLNGARTPEVQAQRRATYRKVWLWPDLVLPAEVTAPHGGRTPTPEQADPRPDPRVAAVTLAVPVAALMSEQSLKRIQVPVGLVSASADQVLLPRFHSDRVLRHVKTVVHLAALNGAGHFDVLWPWPEATAREVAALQQRGGLPEPGFDARERDAAHAKIASFFVQHLEPPRP